MTRCWGLAGHNHHHRQSNSDTCACDGLPLMGRRRPTEELQVYLATFSTFRIKATATPLEHTAGNTANMCSIATCLTPCDCSRLHVAAEPVETSRSGRADRSFVPASGSQPRFCVDNDCRVADRPHRRLDEFSVLQNHFCADHLCTTVLVPDICLLAQRDHAPLTKFNLPRDNSFGVSEVQSGQPGAGTCDAVYNQLLRRYLKFPTTG